MRIERIDRHRRKGVAAVEMAIVAAFILVPAVYGMIELASAMQVKDYLSGAARSGASTASQAGAADPAVHQSVASVVSAMAIDPNLATVEIKINGADGALKNAKRGDRISVKVSVPAAQVNWMLPLFMKYGTVESEAVVMMRQG